MGARWYDPALGRWISPDSTIPDSKNPQSFNRYSYVRNNSLRYTDPTGHKEDGECGANGSDCEGAPPSIDDVIMKIIQGMYDGIFDPGRTQPIELTLPDGTMLVIMPVASEPYASRPEFLKQLGNGIGRAGLLLDVAELVLVADLLPGDEDLMGGLDFFVTATGDICTGSTSFFPQVGPSLGPSLLIGQDTLWTGGVDTIFPAATKLVGTGLAGPGGYGGGLVVDAATTGSSLLYDAGRNIGFLPNSVKVGATYDKSTGLTPVLVLYPGQIAH